MWDTPSEASLQSPVTESVTPALGPVPSKPGHQTLPEHLAIEANLVSFCPDRPWGGTMRSLRAVWPWGLEYFNSAAKSLPLSEPRGLTGATETGRTE